jgi:predicted DNA-binding WGR domain protein
MAAMDEIAILLQGRNAEANRHRAWRVEAGRDLFGKWMVRVSFGRIGCRGRTFARKFASEDEARAYARRPAPPEWRHSALPGRVLRHQGVAHSGAAAGCRRLVAWRKPSKQPSIALLRERQRAQGAGAARSLLLLRAGSPGSIAWRTRQ